MSDFFINQDEWIEPGKPLSVDIPRRSWRNRLFGTYPYAVQVRIEPPSGVDLQRWGGQIAERLAMPVPTLGPNDRAAWLSAVGFGRDDRGAAEGIVRYVSRKLPGVPYHRLAVRVSRESLS